MKNESTRKQQERVLKALSGRIDEFYLAGGTALSLFYFQHRLSVDLDFFTQEFSQKRIREIMDFLQDALKRKVELKGHSLGEKEAKMLVYHVYFGPTQILKIDFIEDTSPLLKPTKRVEDIRVMSLEDIYVRKLYAIVGALSRIDAIGRKKFVGGRLEAKDFYDLYVLSHTFTPLSMFVEKYGSPLIREGLVRWFRSYDRMNMIDGVLTLKIGNEVDYKKIENHFKKEIDKIIETQLEDI